MEMRKVTSFQTRQSMGNKEICILVVHDDPIFCNILAKMLQYCSHYEASKQTIKDALSTIREKKDSLILFVTDIHRSNTNGFEILQYIKKEFKLAIMSMSPYENTKLVPIGLTDIGNLFFLKSWSVNDFNTLWQYAYAEERGKTTSDQDTPLLDENMVEASLGNTSLFREVAWSDQKRTRRESQERTEQNDATSDDSPNEKRQRVNWTDHDLHHKFLEAIKELGVGPDRASPKQILELMNVPGLRRESVASHLQKHHLSMRRTGEVIQSTGSIFGSKLTTQLKKKCSSSSHFAQNFNSSLGNPLYLNQPPKLTSQQPGSIFSCLFHPEASNPEASTSTSNLGHEQLLTGTYSYGHSVSPFDATAQNDKNLFDFGTAQSNSQTGAQMDSGCVSGTQVNLNCVTGAIFPEIGNGRSSNAVSAYVGYRLACNGKSVETGQMVVSGDDENRTNKVNLSAGGSGNESLVQNPLALGNDNPQQQPSQPLVHSVGHDFDNLVAEGEVDHLLDATGKPPVHFVGYDLDNLGAEGEVDRLLDATGSKSPQFFWNDDFYDQLFENTD